MFGLLNIDIKIRDSNFKEVPLRVKELFGNVEILAVIQPIQFSFVYIMSVTRTVP